MRYRSTRVAGWPHGGENTKQMNLMSFFFFVCLLIFLPASRLAECHFSRGEMHMLVPCAHWYEKEIRLCVFPTLLPAGGIAYFPLSLLKMCGGGGHRSIVSKQWLFKLLFHTLNQPIDTWDYTQHGALTSEDDLLCFCKIASNKCGFSGMHSAALSPFHMNCGQKLDGHL